MDNNIINTEPPKEEDEEEEKDDDALSLSDFPLKNSDVPEKNQPHKAQDRRRSSSEPSDFFEFFSDFTTQMSNAEDIIFRGKLVPYNHRHHHHQILKSLSADDATRRNNRRPPDLIPAIRSSSLTSARPPRPENGRRSPGGETLRRRRRLRDTARSDAADIRRSFSRGSEGSARVWKPRWFVLMFGPTRLQREMDLRDMRSRQVRRSPGSMFPILDAGGETPAKRSERRNFWGFDLLKVLSCKSHASVAVTASVGLAPRF